MCDFTAISWSVDSNTSQANGFYVPHMVLNTSLSITQRSNGQMGEPQVLIFVKIDQKFFKFPFASDFIAISGSVDNTASLLDGFYVPHMVSNTS